MAQLQTGAIEDGTAIGDAILAALNRLRGGPAERPAGQGANGQAKSQAIILITDGRSNAGASSPQVAAAAARKLGIRVHTIGIGSSGPAVIPVEDPLGGTAYRSVQADLDEVSLREIAATTGGSYFRADDRDILAPTVQVRSIGSKSSHRREGVLFLPGTVPRAALRRAAPWPGRARLAHDCVADASLKCTGPPLLTPGCACCLYRRR